jgi:hypothetical protein
MWPRSNADRVECRFGGEHVASSARLRVVTARFSAWVRSWQFTRDGEARFWLGWGPEDAMTQLPPTPITSDPLLLDPAFLLGFMAVHGTTGREVAWIDLRRGADGAYLVGGMVDHGRVIESLWWQRVDATAKRRCRARSGEF